MPKESTKATITSFAGTPLVRVVDGSNSRNISPANLVAESGAQTALDGRYVSYIAPSGGDDTAAIQAILTAGGVCQLGEGDYTITSALTIDKSGSGIVGRGHEVTRVSQTTSAENGVDITRDEGTYIVGWELRGFELRGNGAGTSTGYGISHFDTDDTTYTSNRGTIDGVKVSRFGTVARLIRGDSMTVNRFMMEDCGTGLTMDGNANGNTIDYVVGGVEGTHLTLGAGTFLITPRDVNGSDLGSGEFAIDVELGAKVVIQGGNFESCTGDAWVRIQNSGKVICFGSRFLKGDGNEVPAFDVNAGALAIGSVTFDGYNSDTALIRKSNLGAVVETLGWLTSTLASSLKIEEYSGGSRSTIYPVPKFPTRIENSLLTPAAATRGLIYQKVARDASNGEDALYMHVRDRVGGVDGYTRRALSKVIEGTGSPESAVSARVGTLYVRTDGGTGTTLYVKESGTGNTGWVAK